MSIVEERSISHLSDSILEKIFAHLTDRQLKDSCSRVNQQWNQSVCKGLVSRSMNERIDLRSFVRLVLRGRSAISRLPTELLLRLFRFYLNPLDLLRRCRPINQQWKHLTHDPTLWRSLNPINWAKGFFLSLSLSLLI